jgi:putative endonuclease
MAPLRVIASVAKQTRELRRVLAKEKHLPFQKKHRETCLKHQGESFLVPELSNMQKRGFVYILTNHRRHTVLYTGVTSNLLHRIYQHQISRDLSHFTARYDLKKLVYYCQYPSILEAIYEEKRIKAGSREAKVQLIESMNPDWMDLWTNDVSFWRM